MRFSLLSILALLPLETTSERRLCVIDETMELEEGLVLKQSITPDKQQVHMKLIYKGQGWLGFGFSKDGVMVGSTVIVGFPDEPRVPNRNPGKFILINKSATDIRNSVVTTQPATTTNPQAAPAAQDATDVPSLSLAPSTSTAPSMSKQVPTLEESRVPVLEPTMRRKQTMNPSEVPVTRVPTRAPTPSAPLPPPPVRDWREETWTRSLVRDLQGDSTLGGLTNATLFQNDTHTVLQFQRPLYYNNSNKNDQVLTVIDQNGLNTFIYAVGRSNVFAFHSLYGSRPMSFDTCPGDNDNGMLGNEAWALTEMEMNLP